MATKLIILVTLEHLAAHDASDGSLFGMTLSVATDTSVDVAQEYMKLYNWARVTTLAVRVGKAGDLSTFGTTSTPVSVTEFTYRGMKIGALDELREHAVRALEDEFGQGEGNDRFAWMPDANGRRMKSTLQADKKSSRAWHTILGQTARLAAPIPQVLRLSYTFKLPKSLTFGPTNWLAAAPEFGTPLAPASGPLKPADVAITAITPVVGAWPYDALLPNGFEAEARLMPATFRGSKAQTSKPDAFIDLGSLWVLSPSGNERARKRQDQAALTVNRDTSHQDWRALLESRMADALDLGARILEAAHELPAAGRTREVREFVRDTVVASLRDLTGIGYRSAPSGRALVDTVLLATSPKAVPLFDTARNTNALANVAALEKQVKGELGSLDKWIGLLKAVFPAFETSIAFGGDVPGEMIESEAFERTLTELERLRQVVLEPASLDRLLRAQWNAVKGAGGELSKLGDLANLAELPTVDLRRRLALENLWAFWKDFFAAAQKQSTGTSTGREFICAEFKNLLVAYFALRFPVTLPPAAPGDPSPCAAGSSLGLKIDFSPAFSPANQTPLRGFVLSVCRHLSKWGQRTAPRLTGDASNACDPAPATKTDVVFVEPTELPHDLALQVSLLAAPPDGATEQSNVDADPLDHIAGMGVLMRNATRSGSKGTGWRCLNFASPIFRTVGCVEPYAVVVPLKIGYANGLRQSLVTYSNQPVVAASPLGSMPGSTMDPSGTASVTSAVDNLSSLVRYVYPGLPKALCPSPPPAIPKLPALVFGDSYELLPFLITNSGAVPKALAREKEPCTVDVDAFDSTKVKGLPIRTVTYARRVRVGAPRLSKREVNVPKEKDRFQLPPILQGVAPRARDLKIDTRLPTGMSDAERQREHPILLLHPWKRDANDPATFEFFVQPPATDIHTWDRWVAKENSETNGRLRRKRLWADYAREASKNRAAAGTAETKDLSIDDPAACAGFYVELVQLDAPATANAPGTYLPFPAPADQADPSSTSLVSHRIKGVKIRCKHVETPSKLIEPTATEPLTAEVTAGSVYALTIWSCLEEGDLTRFDEIFHVPKKELRRAPKGTRHVLVTPQTILIEAATEYFFLKPALVGQEDPDVRRKREAQLLYDLTLAGSRLLAPQAPLVASESAACGSQPTPTPAAAGDVRRDTVDVMLGDIPKDASKPEQWLPHRSPYLQRAELLRQAWRWQGRETASHPVSKADGPTPTASVNEWEAKEFGNRRDADHLAVSMETQLHCSDGTRTFTYTEALAEYDASTPRPGADLRAHHFRFSARVWSRYAPLMPDEGLLEARTYKVKPGDPLTADPVSIWTSTFVPCREREKLKAPKVKLILPLTESFGAEASGSAGALVIFDEPWYQIGGIDERIEAEVVEVNDKNCQPYYEVGADPILDTTTGGYPVASYALQLPNELVRGPIGHTFDVSDDAPYLAITSFIIPPPRVERRADQTTEPVKPWTFAKIRFRRTVRASRPEGTPGQFETIAGEPTDAYWVQFVPEFSVVSVVTKEHVRPESLRAKRKDDGFVVKMGTREIALTPAVESDIFERYLVATERVADVTGRLDQERYLGVLTRRTNGATITPDTTWVPLGDWEIPVDAKRRLRFRVVDVQRIPTSKKPTDGETFWKLIFDKKTPDRDRARIVAVSAPIEIENAAAHGAGGNP